MKRSSVSLKGARSEFLNSRGVALNGIVNNLKMPDPYTIYVNICCGLGNQLFQIACGYAYSRITNGKLAIPHIKNSGNRPVYWDTLLRKVNKYLVTELYTSQMETFRENYALMYKNIGLLRPQGKNMIGYFQTSKYFYNDDIKDEIKELFRPEQDFIDEIISKYGHILDESVRDRVVVIHSRRTDYLTSGNYYNILDINYYKKAISIMLERVQNPIFLLCGDDNKFWEQVKNDIPEVFQNQYFILEENDILTFTLLQQFKNFIMANSTFIWWCVWLSKDTKNVIAPSRWFGSSGPKKYSDIYESSWILL